MSWAPPAESRETLSTNRGTPDSDLGVPPEPRACAQGYLTVWGSPLLQDLAPTSSWKERVLVGFSKTEGTPMLLLGLGDHFVRGSVTVARVLFGAARAVLSRFFEAGGRYFWWWIISWLGRSWLLLLRFDFGLGFQASALNNQP